MVRVASKIMSGSSVSVVIPAYRAAHTIGRAVDSLLAQVRPPDEILVVDDGSPDDLPAALDPYGERVRLLRKPNGGVASARNLGIERSYGDLIAFLDADDYWEPTKLERQLEVLRRYPEIGLVASRYYVQPPNRPREKPARAAESLLDRVQNVSGAEAFEFATRIWTSTVVVRRSALGQYRFDSGLETAEDRDLWVRIIASHSIYLIGEPLATLVLEPGSLSRSSIDIDCRNMLRVVRRHGDLLGRRGLRKWEADTFRRWAGVKLSQGEPHAALTHAWAHLRGQPFSLQGWWILAKSALLATVPSRREVQPMLRR
jgi:glycosyltransferase involved in cell wall biosynthesis